MQRPMLLILALVCLFAIVPFVRAAPPGPTVVAGPAMYVPQVTVVPLGTPVTIVNPAIDGVSGTHTWTTANSLAQAFQNNPNDEADSNCIVDGEIGEDASTDTCSLSFPPGSTHIHTFLAPGTYVFYCRIHLQQRMAGIVSVV